MCESLHLFLLLQLDENGENHHFHTAYIAPKEVTNLINIDFCVFRIIVNFISMKIMKLLRIMVCKQHCSGPWSSTVSHSDMGFNSTLLIVLTFLLFIYSLVLTLFGSFLPPAQFYSFHHENLCYVFE
jgi:hypothetical protein